MRGSSGSPGCRHPHGVHHLSTCCRPGVGPPASQCRAEQQVEREIGVPGGRSAPRQSHSSSTRVASPGTPSLNISRSHCMRAQSSSVSAVATRPSRAVHEVGATESEGVLGCRNSRCPRIALLLVRCAERSRRRWPTSRRRAAATRPRCPRVRPRPRRRARRSLGRGARPAGRARVMTAAKAACAAWRRVSVRPG